MSKLTTTTQSTTNIKSDEKVKQFNTYNHTTLQNSNCQTSINDNRQKNGNRAFEKW